MPQVIDKIRQNSGDFVGDANCMKRAFAEGLILGKEIAQVGGGSITGNALLNEDAKLHLAEQESICDALDKAMGECVARQRALNNKRRKWLDTKL